MTTVTTQPLPSCVDCGRPMRGTHTLLADCLDYAMATEVQRDRHGVWGGLTPTARDRLWHEQRLQGQEAS